MKLDWRPVSLVDGLVISTSLTDVETVGLQNLAQGADVLEVGSAFGYSAIAMALGGARRIVAVDPHVWLDSYDKMTAHLVAHGVADKVEIVRADSRDALPALVADGQLFDLVWIDGDHEAHVVASDVHWARQLLKPTGTLACHDYGEDTCPGVRAALDAWKPPPVVVDTLAVYGPGEW